MTFHAHNHLRRRGYTFLEITLALAIVSVVFFSVVPMILSTQRERRLQRSMEDIAQLVRDCRFATEKSSQPATLVFQGNTLQPSEKKADLAPVAVADAKLFIRYPGGKWEKANGQGWKFYAGGRVEPISVRLEQGGAWIESDFDFLTGSVSDERYSF